MIAEPATADTHLLIRFADDGDATAFADLVSRHAPLVFSVCRSVLGRHHDAEDAAQAAFLTLARRASELRAHPSVAGWLHRVAWHVATRARTARELRSIRERQSSEVQRDHPELKDANDAVARVHQALAALPEKYRLPLVLHHLEGWSEQETAEVLGCRLGTVSGRLSRGRALLRRALEAPGAVIPVTLSDLMSPASGDAIPAAFVERAVASTSTQAVPAHVAALAHAAGRLVAADTRRRWLVRITVTAVTTLAVTMLIMALAWGIVRRSSRTSAVSRPPSVQSRIVAPAGPLVEAIARPRTPGWVAGQVRGPSGGPVRAGRALVYRTLEDSLARSNELASSPLDSTGRFEVSSLPESDSYVVVVVIYADPAMSPEDFSTRISGSCDVTLVHVIAPPNPRR